MVGRYRNYAVSDGQVDWESCAGATELNSPRIYEEGNLVAKVLQIVLPQ